MPEILQRLTGWDDENRRWIEEGLQRVRRTVIPGENGRDQIDGRSLWNFGTNDYLGLARDPRVVAAATEALSKYGAGARASPVVVGRTGIHEELEARLAEFEGTAAALVFPSGYAANTGVIAALVGAEDVVFCDRLNHASLVDGCRLSGARLRVFPHRDVNALENDLQKQKSQSRRRLIVTDSVFSMDGDWAPLKDLCDLADRYEAIVLVDEAHATGLYGPHGRGLAEHFGVEDRCLRIGTLSKALGSQGGFLAGDRDLIDGLWNRGRTQMFSTALTPAACGAVVAALRIIREEPQRREDLLQRCRDFTNGLRTAGVLPSDYAPEEFGPIVPIPIGSAERALEKAAQLAERGYLVPAIRPPTVPRDSSRLRVSLSWSIPPEVINELKHFLMCDTLKRP